MLNAILNIIGITMGLIVYDTFIKDKINNLLIKYFERKGK